MRRRRDQVDVDVDDVRDELIEDQGHRADVALDVSVDHLQRGLCIRRHAESMLALLMAKHPRTAWALGSIGIHSALRLYA